MVVHGLAASIRAAEESETFDLAGQTAATISSTIHDAFQEPFLMDAGNNQEMIRITLVVGAGKQARQKYDDQAARAVVTELQGCGYTEDRAASAIIECAGTYKSQHDTAKNLKTIVIFPKIKIKGITTTGEEGEAGGATTSLIPENSPGYKLAVSSIPLFQSMLKSQCPSWSQKRGCLTCIEGLKELIQDLDNKLIKGTPLDAAEQAFYDVVSDLEAKEQHVKEVMSQQVDAGQITQQEKNHLLEQNAERIMTLEKEGKSTAKALQRKEMLEDIDPIAPRKLKHEAEIRKLQKELVPLIQIAEQSRGRLLSVKETQKLARKEEIEEEIEALEQASWGWFENEEAFEARLAASRAFLESALKGNKKKAPASYAAAIGGSTGGGSSNANKKISVASKPIRFVVPMDTGGGGKSKNKKKNGKANNLFGAMMMDSDSDEEEQVKTYSPPNRQSSASNSGSSEWNTATGAGNTATTKKKHTISVSAATSHGIKSKNNKKKNKLKGSDVFMAAIGANNDDDSDEDENQSESEENIENDETTKQQDECEEATSKKSKKRKKKKAIKSRDTPLQGEAALEEEYNKVKKAEQAEKEAEAMKNENRHPALVVLTTVFSVMFYLIMAIITWLASLVLGTPKKKKQK